MTPVSGRLSRAGAGGGLVFAALAIWSLANYAFFFLAGRELGPAQFGLVSALVAVPVIVSVPCNALQYGIARAETGAGGEAVYPRALRAAVRGGALVVAIGGLAVAGAEWVDASVPAVPLLLTVVAVAALPPLFLALGRAQGRRRFAEYASGFIVWGLSRPLALLVLLAVGLGVSGAVGASTLSIVLGAAVAAALVGDRGAAAAPDAEVWRTFRDSLAPVSVGLGAVAILTNLDVVAAKLLLSADDAGYYGAASVLGKAVVLLPQTIALVTLPDVADRAARGVHSARGLGMASSASIVLGGIAALAALPLADPVVRIAFGPEFLPASPLVPLLVVAGTLLGLALVVVTYRAARAEYRFLWCAGAVSLLFPVILAVVASTPREIAVVTIVFGVVVLALHEVIYRDRPDSLVRATVGVFRSAT